jgi:hypothetical protein
MVFCSKCGTKNIDEPLYCSACGEKIVRLEDQEIPQGTNNEVETLKELIHISWITGAVPPPRKILSFTEKNIYLMEGSFLKGIGFGVGGILGYFLEQHDNAQKERDVRTTNFNELAKQDPHLIIIPYQEIINLKMGKKKMMLNPMMTLKTAAEEYNFLVMDRGKYEQYQKTIPALLRGRVTVE